MRLPETLAEHCSKSYHAPCDESASVRLRNRLHTFPSNSSQALSVYGSAARGEEKADSDIDVLVLGEDLSAIKVNAAFKPVGRKHHRVINASVYGRDEFIRMARAKDAFALNVLAQATIMLKGVLHAAA